MARLSPPPGFGSIRSRPRLPLKPTLAVLGLALSLRLLVVWIVITRFPPQWFFMRGMEMGLLAKSLLAGQGLSSPFGGDTGPSAFVAPVYPILVAAVFKMFGAFSVASEVVVLLGQVALNLATIFLIMHIARQLFNQAAATIAGLVWACSLPLLWMPTIFWETSLSCCLLTGLIAFVLRYKQQAKIDPVVWLKLGAYCGFAGLVNPAILPSLAATIAWVAWTTRTQSGKKPLLAVLTFVLVFAPWPIRNAVTFHAFIPLRTTVGFELWMGNHAGSTGFLDESLFPTFNPEELGEYQSFGEVGYTQRKSKLAREYISSHPKEFIRLTTRRAVRFWTGTGTQHGSRFFEIHAVLTTFWGLAGLLLLLRSRQFDLLSLFALPLVLFSLPYLITHAEFRYRLVIDPLLTIFAAYSVTEFYRVLVTITHGSLIANASVNTALVPPPIASPGRVTW